MKLKNLYQRSEKTETWQRSIYWVAWPLVSFFLLSISACVTSKNDPNLAIGAKSESEEIALDSLKYSDYVVLLSFDKSEFFGDAKSIEVSLRAYPTGRLVKQEKFHWNVEANEAPVAIEKSEKEKLLMLSWLP